MPDFDLDAAFEQPVNPRSKCCAAPLVQAGVSDDFSEDGSDDRLSIAAECSQCHTDHQVMFRFVENSGASPDFSDTARNYTSCPACGEGMDFGGGGTVTSNGLCSEEGQLDHKIPLAVTIWFGMLCPACGPYREVYRQSEDPEYA